MNTTTKINWKIVAATLTSALTVLAALPYTLGDVATIIPPAWKSKIVIAGLVATTVLRLVNTKMVSPPTTTPVEVVNKPNESVPTTEQSPPTTPL